MAEIVILKYDALFAGQIRTKLVAVISSLVGKKEYYVRAVLRNRRKAKGERT